MRIGNLEIETRSPTYIGFVLNGAEGSAHISKGLVTDVIMDSTTAVPYDILQEVKRRLQLIVTNTKGRAWENDDVSI